jgi:hypothetical protein
MPKLLLLFLLSLSTSAVCAEPPSGVTATLSLVAPDKLSIRYDIPDSCQALSFINNGFLEQAALGIRSDWQSSDGCATVDGRAVRRTGAACKSLQFTVPANQRRYDRVYPWALSIGGRLYSHTSAFAVDASCGPVNWRFSAPHGTVVVNGVPALEGTARSAQSGNVGYAPVIFLSAPLEGPAAARSYVDPRLSSATGAFVGDAVTRAFALYSRSLPGLEAAHGFVVIAKSPEQQGWWGDAASHTTIRVMVPAILPAAMEHDVGGFVAHEVAHMFQPPVWHDSWDGDQAMLSEGGAEVLQLLAQSQPGWADSGYLKRYLESAINRCVIAAEGRNWKGIGNRGWGRTPYNCGLTLHVLGLAARSTKAPAWDVMRDYYLAVRKGGATDFATALECGAKAGCGARWLSRIAGDEPLGAVLSAYAQTGGFLKPAKGDAPALVEPVMRSLFSRLMRIDCGGQVSIYEEPGVARIGPAGSCKTLREGMLIVAVEGQPMFGGAAGAALVDACGTKGLVRFGLQDGRALELGCSAAQIGTLPQLFEVDMDVLRDKLR